MNAPNFTRSHDWWEPKVTLIISMGLLPIYLYSASSPTDGLLFLLLLICSTVFGAVYVSLINDFTDLEEDLKAGKKNRLQNFSSNIRIGLISASVIGIVIFIYLFLSYPVGLSFLIASWIVYTLYSFPPVRLKARKGWGVLADSLGAHVFPSMGIFAIVSDFLVQSVDWYALTLIGLWSLFYGFRGILGHQYLDRIHDEMVGLDTFATQFPVHKIAKLQLPLFMVEFILLFGILLYFQLFPLLFLLGIYLLYILILKLPLGIPLVLVLHPEQPNWNILMAGYYQVFLPVGLMCLLGWNQSWVYLLIPIFIVLFPNEIQRNIAFLKSLFGPSQPKEL
jgi:4-hydroxybenzoate polyprenyltransferase